MRAKKSLLLSIWLLSYKGEKPRLAAESKLLSRPAGCVLSKGRAANSGQVECISKATDLRSIQGSAAHGFRDSICMRKLHTFCMFLAGQLRLKHSIK